MQIIHAAKMKSSSNNNPLKALAYFAILSAYPNCLAADTTINGAQTTTQGPMVPELNGSDSLTVTTNGSISVTDDDAKGISATGGSNQIINNGSIQTTGSGAAGNADGISATGGSSVIINNGTIRTFKDSARGIGVSGNSNAIINNGLIETVLSTGISAATGSNSNQIINNGTIRTTGDDAEGIRANGSLNTITNTGVIITTGASTSPGEAAGINAGAGAGGGSNSVTNSGTIVSYHGNSIHFSRSGNTLNLLNDSFLGGGIELGSGTQVSITTGANHSKLINYSGTLSGISANGPVPVFINTSTKQLATYEPTFFAASTDALGDMTSTISSLTPGRFNGTNKDYPLWARGFGMTSSYSGSDATLSRKYIYSGVAMGYDFMRSKSLMLGALGGYGQTSLTTDGSAMQSYNNSSDDGFLGLYGQKRWKDLSLDFALYGGVQSFRQQRYVNDNLAYLGNSSTQASLRGWWLAPEAGITYKAGELNGWSLLPTARLRYAQQWMGAYTESGGGSANATVNGRNVAIGQSFVGIGTRRMLKTTLGKDTKMVLEGQVGYLYRGSVGANTVGVTMIGQSLALPTEVVSRHSVAVTAGVTIDLSSEVALKIRGDAAVSNGINYAGGGWAGLSVKF
jgi:hypothetical protein